MSEYDDFLDAYEYVGDEYDGDESEAPCIGAECLNPHPDHHADECYTLEMCEAQGADAMRSTPEFKSGFVEGMKRAAEIAARVGVDCVGTRDNAGENAAELIQDTILRELERIR